jgi:hypothetical protein
LHGKDLRAITTQEPCAISEGATPVLQGGCCFTGWYKGDFVAAYCGASRLEQ